eukprot:sb/3467049/
MTDQLLHSETGLPGLVAQTTPLITTLVTPSKQGELTTTRDKRAYARNKKREVVDSELKETPTEEQITDITVTSSYLTPTKPAKLQFPIISSTPRSLPTLPRKPRVLSLPSELCRTSSTHMSTQFSPVMVSMGTQTDNPPSKQDQETTTDFISNPLSPPHVAINTISDSHHTAVQIAPAAPTTTSPPPATSPVSVLCTDFAADFTADDMISGLNLTREGNRQVTHFGESYSYGGISHPSKPFPASGPISEIQEELQKLIPEFDKGWSCLLNYYPTGKSSIPWHSDDEPAIKTANHPGNTPFHRRKVCLGLGYH